MGIRAIRQIAWFCLCVCLLSGCSRSTPLPDQLILYSIDGRDYFPPDQPPQTVSEEDFHGYPIVGSVEVTSQADRQMLIEAYDRGVAEGENKVAGCFWPRHGMRTVRDGTTTDYVICFECMRSHVYGSGEKSYESISRGPRETFNDYLSKSGVAVVPSQLD